MGNTKNGSPCHPVRCMHEAAVYGRGPVVDVLNIVPVTAIASICSC